MKRRLLCYGLSLVLLAAVFAQTGCSAIKDIAGDPVVQHCAGQTFVAGLIGGVAATTLAGSKASKTAAGVIGGAGTGAVAFLICKRSFDQARALEQRLAALEQQAAEPAAQQEAATGPEPQQPPPGNEERMVDNLEVVDNRAIRLDLNSSLMFASGQATLQPRAYAHLDVLASSLQENAGSKVAIIGHTDNVGTSSLNRRLSQQRAQIVSAYLAEKGVDQSSLEAKGVGDAEPIADNATPEGRAKNRRVEIVIMPETA